MLSELGAQLLKVVLGGLQTQSHVGGQEGTHAFVPIPTVPADTVAIVDGQEERLEQGLLGIVQVVVLSTEPVCWKESPLHTMLGSGVKLYKCPEVVIQGLTQLLSQHGEVVFVPVARRDEPILKVFGPGQVALGTVGVQVVIAIPVLV